MTEESLQSEASVAVTLARKSWTAYVRLALIGVLALPVIALIAAFAFPIGAAMLVALIVVLPYQAMQLRSYRLYHDEMGVWLFRGVFPWEKRVVGVKWRDLDEALYFTNLLSWLCRSYTIRVGHRFTKSSELLLTHMARGDIAALTVNSIHQELVRERGHFVVV